MKQMLGKQIMLELYGCNTKLLNDIKFIEKTLLASANIANATIVKHFFHQFSPHGISGTVIIAESHICIHTWPEYDYAAIDVFTCSDEMKDEQACSFLEKEFEAKEAILNSFKRGSLEKITAIRDLQIQHHHQ